MEKKEVPMKDETGLLLEKNGKLREEKRTHKVKSINLSGDQWIVLDDLPGVFCEGIQYYDLGNIRYVNNSGIASLIELLKSLLQQGVEVQFVNVNERIRNKIKAMGLDHILVCC